MGEPFSFATESRGEATYADSLKLLTNCSNCLCSRLCKYINFYSIFLCVLFYCYFYLLKEEIYLAINRCPVSPFDRNVTYYLCNSR